MTEIKSEFREKLKEFKDEYEAERKGLNIFRALHKEHDEKYLHSRFISYLLSPTSQHGMGNKFLKAFVDILKQNKNGKIFETFNLSGCEVTPNEENKAEYENIDILIENDTQAIVIENKIFADDSIHDVNKEEKQTIEISTHINDNSKHNTPEALKQHQLDTYCKRMEERAKKKQKKVDVIAIYLTPYEREPSIIINHKPLVMIHYHKEIIEWINKCIDIVTKSKDTTNHNQFIIEILYQYISVVRSFTSNLKRVKEIRDLLDDKDKIIEAWKIKKYIFEKDKRNGKEIKQLKWGDFKHVQWHTIADFWDELADSIEGAPFNAKITNKITIEEISGIVHKNKKGSYGLTFELGNGQEWYIVNDNINGLTYGKIFEGRITLEQIDNILNSKNNEAYGICFILDDGKEWYITNDKIKSTYREKLEEMSKNKHRIKIWFEISKNIKFTDFSNEDTFMLINTKKREGKIEEIINKLKENPLLMKSKES